MRISLPVKAVTYTPEALIALRKHRSQATAIMAKIARYAETGAGDIKTLTGRLGKRIRFGDYRAIFEETETEIRVLAIGPRGSIYE